MRRFTLLIVRWNQGKCALLSLLYSGNVLNHFLLQENLPSLDRERGEKSGEGGAFASFSLYILCKDYLTGTSTNYTFKKTHLYSPYNVKVLKIETINWALNRWGKVRIESQVSRALARISRIKESVKRPKNHLFILQHFVNYICQPKHRTGREILLQILFISKLLLL